MTEHQEAVEQIKLMVAQLVAQGFEISENMGNYVSLMLTKDGIDFAVIISPSRSGEYDAAVTAYSSSEPVRLWQVRIQSDSYTETYDSITAVLSRYLSTYL